MFPLVADFGTLTSVLLLAALVPGRLGAQTLELPPRAAQAPGGEAVMDAVRGLDPEGRESRIRDEIAGGNVPSWLRTFRPVRMTRELDGRRRTVTFWVAPDVLAVGSDDDYVRIPLTSGVAQRIADLTGTSLLTPVMSDAVWAAADVRLGPDSIPPGPAMTTAAVFERHHVMVSARRAVHPDPAGSLVAGHKKDVVLTARLDSLPDRLAIYGWHRPDGRPIQSLYTGHASDWVDYSHGIRLASRSLLIDGEPHDIIDVLRDPALALLLLDDGPMRTPRYPTGDGREPSGSLPTPEPREAQLLGGLLASRYAIREPSSN